MLDVVYDVVIHDLGTLRLGKSLMLVECLILCWMLIIMWKMILIIIFKPECLWNMILDFLCVIGIFAKFVIPIRLVYIVYVFAILEYVHEFCYVPGNTKSRTWEVRYFV